MEWKEFNIDKIKTPSEIIDKEIQGFTKATNSLLMLSLVAKTNIERIKKRYEADFQYDLILHSQKLRKFRFDVFELIFDATLFPCHIIIEKGIQEEFGLQSSFITIEYEEKLISIIERIFQSNRFEEIVNGLMRISSIAKVEDEDDFPF
jgi:hypothetical protein